MVQTSDVSALLSTRGFQRGCVTQTSSEFGKELRRLATAGNAWTISPREPSRTTKRRGSGMRDLANGVEQISRRVVFGIADDGHADAQAGRCGPLGNGFRGVVGAFRVNV